MRIILILDTAHVNGGQAKVAFDSALGLKRMGHDPVIFAAVSPVATELVEAGIPVHCLGQSELVKDGNVLKAALRGIDNRDAANALRTFLAEQPRDNTIIHVHGWAKALSSSIAAPIRESGLPVLYTMHEYFLLCPNGGFYNYQQHQHCHLKPLGAACISTNCDSRTHLHKLWRVGRSLAMKHVHRLPEAVRDIAYFHPFQRAIIAPHVPEGARLHEVGNPIEIEPIGQKENPTSGEIIFLGRISREKGCFLYAEAMQRVGLTPVFVGDGPVAAEVKARFPEAIMHGWHDAAGVRRRLREARALVFPSLWYEGQPLTVLESLALGTPVIAGDGSAGRESVVDGETGLWFKQADVESLSAAIERARDDATITRLSHAAHQRYWAEPFTIERHCQRLLEVYGGLKANA